MFAMMEDIQWLTEIQWFVAITVEASEREMNKMIILMYSKLSIEWNMLAYYNANQHNT